MSNSQRTRITGGPIVYFALQNGGRRPTSFTPGHRDRLSGLVSASLTACPSARVHAFSWTSSEIRIALEAGDGDLRQFVRAMSMQHREHAHSEICGSECLFDRGYGGTPVDDEAQLVNVVEHIHNAPVRAGLVSDAAEYQWSSCRAYLGLTRIPWLTMDLVAPVLSRIRGRSGLRSARRNGISERLAAPQSPV